MAGLAATVGSGAMTNSIRDITEADVLLVTGSNTTEAHPVMSLEMKKAVRKMGAKLILVDPRQIELSDFAHLHLRHHPGTDVALFNAMAHIIINSGWVNKAFVDQRTEGFNTFQQSVANWTPNEAASITGVAENDIIAAARLYAQATNGMIFWAMGITQHTTGTDNVKALSNLALLTGQIGRPGTGLNPLRGQNNVQGACDLGGLPNVFPGYQAVAIEENRQKISNAWRIPFEQLSPTPGLTVTEMMNGVEEGHIKALFIMGENPMLSDPNLNHVRRALEHIEFLAVQDIFLNETAEMADVVLPAASFAEKSGTFTNTERRVQLIRPVLDAPGLSRPDWQIITDLANLFGANWSYADTDEIFAELASVTPQYGGISHTRLENGGLQWPCPSSDHPGTQVLHVGQFARGKGLFCPVEFQPPREEVDAEYPLILSTGRMLFHWHGGTLSRRSPGLDEIAPEAEVEISPFDATYAQIQSGDLVRVSSRRGTVVAKAKVTNRSPKGTVFMTFHFAEAAANLLTIDAVDPTAKIPEYKACAVSIKKVDASPEQFLQNTYSGGKNV